MNRNQCFMIFQVTQHQAVNKKQLNKTEEKLSSFKCKLPHCI